MELQSRSKWGSYLNLNPKDVPEALKQIGPSFKLEPFATVIQPIIQDVLAEHKKDKYRKGTLLTPLLMVWLVLTLTLRRDMDYHKTLNWLVSGLRWLSLGLPAKLLKDGAISHARVKLGSGVFQSIFYKFVLSFTLISPDFYGLIYFKRLKSGLYKQLIR